MSASTPGGRSALLRIRALIVSLLLGLTLWALPSMFAPTSVWAFDPPALQGFVTDTSGKLTDNDRKVINARLSAYKKASGNRIAIFMVGSLDGEPIADVAYRTFNSWKIGTAGEDNGVLLVIAPNESKGWIETGKGVGGAITDIQADEVLRNVVAPHVQAGRWRDAAIDGGDAIAHLLDKDRPPSTSPSATPGVTPGTRHRGTHHRTSIVGTILKAGVIGIVILGVIGLLAIYVIYRVVRRIFREASGGPPRGTVGGYGGYQGDSYEPPRPGGVIFFGGGGSGHRNDRDDDDSGGGSGGYDPDDSPAGGGESGGGGAGEDF